MGKRVRITSDGLNSYGGRVLTAGMDISQYERNPVLLYMHSRGQVIGILKDLRREDDGITAELDFDQATDLSKQCKKQWEFGSLKMVSVGIDILEMSEDADQVIQGQTSPTITKSKLYEVSLVDIGSNDDAIVLRKDGKLVTLGKGDNPLPKLNIKSQNKKEMDIKILALQLGLTETADEAAINERIKVLLKAEQSNVELLKSKAEMELSAINTAVDGAIAERKIGLDKKEHFVSLGKQIGVDSLKKTFEAMAAQVKLSQFLDPTPSDGQKTYKKLSEVPSNELEKMRTNDIGEYKRLFKAEYGYECEL
jgi:HK97 family phage prohead protease